MPAVVERIDWLGMETEGVISYDTRFVLPDDPRLRVGMTGEVFVVTEEHRHVLTIPNTFLTTNPQTGQITVEVLQPDGRTTLTTAVTIGLQGETTSEIVAGLNAGDVLARFDELTMEFQ